MNYYLIKLSQVARNFTLHASDRFWVHLKQKVFKTVIEILLFE